MWLYRSSMKLEQNRKAIEGKILVSFLWDHWQVQDGICTTKTRPPWKISRSPICFLYLSNSRLKLGTVVGLVLGSSLYPAAQLSMSVWRFPPWKSLFSSSSQWFYEGLRSGHWRPLKFLYVKLLLELILRDFLIIHIHLSTNLCPHGSSGHDARWGL